MSAEEVQILSKTQVAKRLSLSVNTVNRMLREGTFIEPVHISSRRIGFCSDEVDAFIKYLRDKREARQNSKKQESAA